MGISNRDIGSAQYGTGSGISYADIGGAQAAVALAPTGGQVIMISSASKVLIPLMWAKQGKNTRRQFMKNTGVSILGM